MTANSILSKAFIIVFGIATIIGSGGGSSENDTDNDEEVTPPPTITISASNTSVDEESSITINHSAMDYLGNSITSELFCDGGNLEDDQFIAPSVANDTLITCTASATDSKGKSTSDSIDIEVIALTPEIALSDGSSIVSAATVAEIDVSYAALNEGVIDAQLNGQDIKVAVTANNTLAYIPDYNAQGSQTLTVELEGQTITYEYEAASSERLENPKAYLDGFVSKLVSQVDEQLSMAQAKGLSNVKIQELEAIKNSILTISTQGMTDNEINQLAHILYFNLDGLVDEQSSTVAQSYRKAPKYSAMGIDLTSCERAAIKVVASGGLAYLTTLSAAGLAGSGVGIPVAAAVIIAAATSWNVLDYQLDRMGEYCFDWAQNDLDALPNFVSLDSKYRIGSKLSQPVSTNQIADDKVKFFHKQPENFQVKRRFEVIPGAEEFVNSMIVTVNKVRGGLSKFVELIGESNLPTFVVNSLNTPIPSASGWEEIVSPNVISLTSISSDNVTGMLEASENEISLVFSISDLELGEVEFQFEIADSTNSNWVSKIDGIVTLRPPIAYDLSFETYGNDTLTAVLEADFETTFEIVSEPSHGTINLLDPSTGEFSYTPNDNLDETISDTFTYVAKNGSNINEGKSELSNVDIKINVKDFSQCLNNPYINTELEFSANTPSITETLMIGNFKIIKVWKAMYLDIEDFWYGRIDQETVLYGDEHEKAGEAIQHVSYYTEEVDICEYSTLIKSAAPIHRKVFDNSELYNQTEFQYADKGPFFLDEETNDVNTLIPHRFRFGTRGFFDSWYSDFKIYENGNIFKGQLAKALYTDFSLRTKQNGSFISLPEGVGEAYSGYREEFKLSFNTEINETFNGWQTVMVGDVFLAYEEDAGTGTYISLDKFSYSAKQNTVGTWFYGPEGQATIGNYYEYIRYPYAGGWETLRGSLDYGSAKYKILQDGFGNWVSVLDGVFSVPGIIHQEYNNITLESGDIRGVLKGTHTKTGQVPHSPDNGERTKILRQKATTEVPESAERAEITSLLETSDFKATSYRKTETEYQWYQATNRNKQSIVVLETAHRMKLPDDSIDFMEWRKTYEARQKYGRDTGEFQSVLAKHEKWERQINGELILETINYEIYMGESGDWYSRPIND